MALNRRGALALIGSGEVLGLSGTTGGSTGDRALYARRRKCEILPPMVR